MIRAKAAKTRMQERTSNMILKVVFSDKQPLRRSDVCAVASSCKSQAVDVGGLCCENGTHACHDLVVRCKQLVRCICGVCGARTAVAAYDSAAHGLWRRFRRSVRRLAVVSACGGTIAALFRVCDESCKDASASYSRMCGTAGRSICILFLEAHPVRTRMISVYAGVPKRKHDWRAREERRQAHGCTQRLWHLLPIRPICSALATHCFQSRSNGEWTL